MFVGYGNLSPSTGNGRLFVIFYALIGIPLLIVFLAVIGEKLNNLALKLENLKVGLITVQC